MRQHVLVAIAASVLLSACATARPIPYAWGDYSSSLYKLKKDPSDENLRGHKQVLIQIIENSKQQSMRVPPGVYAEYGYIVTKEGKTEEGMKYLDLEAETYPESKAFVERVKAQAIRSTTEKESKK